uniref:Remorin C-terminal domain-containing protein n=1 Tax=Kalanchoe fedtschenkoi TaxID=63787 RepID=A0A7N0VHY0_KALFE
MDYERIHKLQTGVLSPSKLRMKLIGAGHNLRKKDGSKQSNNTSSSRTSPSKHQDSDYGQLVKDSFLLSAEHEAKGFDEEVTGLKLELLSANSCSQGGQSSPQSQESVSKDGWSKKQQQQVRKSESANRVSIVHPARTTAEDDQNLDYDSNASSSSFEFPNGERVRPSQLSRSFSRPASSKWNDAEKWIMSRPAANQASKKKSVMLNPMTRFPMMRVSPESSGEDKVAGGGLSRMLQTKRVDFCQPASQVGLDKFSFAPANVRSTATQPEDKTGLGVVRAVAMRDTGTEMTPMASQDPSRTSTPVGASTPLCSPTVSIPSSSTPGRELPTPTFRAASRSLQLDDKKIASEQEQKLKTWREIMALGVQLGKKNIAAWASKEEKEHCVGQVKMTGLSEFQVRASAWEQVEMTKHEARFRRKEVMIQVWESRQKSKLEAEMRRIEAKVEEMRCQCQTKMLQKIATARHRSEEKREKAEARKNRQAERSAAMAGYIGRKGHIPYSYICCGWA